MTKMYSHGIVTNLIPQPLFSDTTFVRFHRHRVTTGDSKLAPVTRRSLGNGTRRRRRDVTTDAASCLIIEGAAEHCAAAGRKRGRKIIGQHPKSHRGLANEHKLERLFRVPHTQHARRKI